MIDPLVRRAVSHDVADLVELEQVARTQLVDQRGGRRWLEEHPERGPRWAEVVASTPVFVAVLDDVVVGYLVLVLEHPPGTTIGTLARVDEVYVHPEARELGYGDELLATAVAHSRQAGATVLEAEALPGDRDTKNLYERAGITARSITVSTRLDDG